jgi:tetratricopeptide (TPR) repeat protein
MIYIGILFWPVSLNFDYDMHLSNSFWDPAVLGGFFVILTLLFIAWRSRFKFPLISFGIFWFFLTLSIESTIIPIAYVIAEYRLYLPLVGFCIAFVCLCRLLVQNQKIFTILMGVVLLAVSFLTMQRNLVYKNELTLWMDTVAKSPGKSRPYANLAAAYISDKKYKEAFQYLNEALILEPHNYDALNNLAELYGQTGNLDKAISIDQKLLQISPTAAVYNNLGMVYIGKGDWEDAKQSFLKALKSKEADRYSLEIKLNLAKVYWYQGRVNEAIKIYQRLMAYFHNDPRAQYELERLYLSVKKFPQAMGVAQNILDSNNNDPSGLVETGDALATSGYLVLAVRFYTKAIRIDYSCADAYLEFGNILANVHRFDRAIEVWQIGLRFNPSDKRFIENINRVRSMKFQG